MNIYNCGKLLYEVITNHGMCLDDALDLVAPEDWRDRVNEDGYFTDNGIDVYYDDLQTEVDEEE